MLSAVTFITPQQQISLSGWWYPACDTHNHKIKKKKPKKLLVISGLTANWNIGTDSISLFNPVEAQREAPFSSSRPLISHICVSRQDQARPRPVCLEGRRLNPPTCTLQFTLCLLLGKAVNMAWMPCSLLLPLFSLCLLLPWLLLSQHTACKQSSQASRLGWPLTSDTANPAVGEERIFYISTAFLNLV